MIDGKNNNKWTVNQSKKKREINKSLKFEKKTNIFD